MYAAGTVQIWEGERAVFNDVGPVPLRARGLGKRYRRGWALRDCDFEIPPHRVVAMVGPNGAGKSTVMNLVTGMIAPTTGAVEVFGERPTGRGLHPRLAFLGQNKPLYPNLTVAETLTFGARTNRRWDQPYAERLVAEADVPLSAKVGTLSGGQRTRVAMTLALGKRPDLVLLDEPLADLDPLARVETLQLLMAQTRERGITVVLSSHVLADLGGTCDHLLMIMNGRVVLSGGVPELLASHRLVTGPRPRPGMPVNEGAQATVLARDVPLSVGPAWSVAPASLEDLVLGYMRVPAASKESVA
jgi:ABC-2 type transport system ATP-binding protein